MKKLLCCTFAAMLCVAAVSPCFAADSPWTGTWKENLSKSKLAGGTVVIAKTATGYHFTSGVVGYDFALDGKPVTTAGTTTIAYTANPDGSIDVVQTANGTVTMKERRSFSADGKMMTMKDTHFDADGTTSTSETVRKRLSGTTGLVGEWVNAKVTDTEPTVQTIAVTGAMLRLRDLHSKVSIDAKLDGTDAPVSGPQVSPGTTASYKSVSATKLTYTRKLNGTVMAEGVMTLSADGKTLTEESWIPNKEKEKTIDVLEKQ
jgi:hypothetical protein